MIDRLPLLGSWIRPLIFAALLAVPVSAAAVNIFGSLALLLALVSREFWLALPRLRRNTVVLAALLLLLLLLIGVSYTSGPSSEAWTVVRRYRKLLFIPFLLPFFSDELQRLRAIQIFCAGVAVTVLLSWTEWLGWTHVGTTAFQTPPGDSVFGSHITQGYMIAMMVAFCLPLALQATTRLQRAVWIGLGLAGAADIAVVMIGRTGKLILPILLVWGLWEVLRRQKLPRRTLLAIGVTALAVALGGLTITALNPNTSLGTVVTQVQTSLATGKRTSQGERVEFYRKSLELFERRPLTGFGTGSLPTETQALASGASTDLGRMVTRNPHNEFIMWAVQLGLPGLLAFLFFCVSVLRGSFGAEAASAVMLRGAWLVFTLGCLVNSFLLDHLEGHAYVFLIGLLLPL